jgi:hypothetical protein
MEVARRDWSARLPYGWFVMQGLGPAIRRKLAGRSCRRLTTLKHVAQNGESEFRLELFNFLPQGPQFDSPD